jgi:3-phenylpropionate/cinnamic acid dioxygenase small subunit
MGATVIDHSTNVVSSAFEPILTLQIQDFYIRYSNVICDDQLELWPDFFEEQCLYRIIPRANFEANLPVAPLFCESRGALIDRVTAIRSTLVFSPRAITHHVTGMRIVDRESDILRTRTAISVHQTLVEGETSTLLVGKTLDDIRVGEAGLKFVKRDVIYDTELLASALIFPV